METMPNHLDLFSPRFYEYRERQQWLRPHDTLEFTPETFGEFLDLVIATNLEKRRAKKRIPFVSLSLDSIDDDYVCCEAIAQRLPQLNEARITGIYLGPIAEDGVFALMHADAQCEPPSRIMIRIWQNEGENNAISTRGMYALVNGYDAYLNVMQFKPVIGWFAAKLVCDAVFSHWHVALDGIITFPANYDPDSDEAAMQLDPAERYRWFETFNQLTEGCRIVLYAHCVFRAFRLLAAAT